ncbi:MAG TPA: tetratricopeptide repeat protein [Longimicrobiales bacterium]|nr:tetratricopeptide repeat protein [Longimicrobiales bacterium]
MSKHPGSRKTRPQSASEPDDVFVARVLHLGKWAEANQQLLTVLIVVAAILMAGLVYYRNYRSSLNVQAAQQLELVYQTASIQDMEGAVNELTTFLERFSGTAYEGEARLVLGEIYLRDGRSEQAQAVLEPLGSSPRRPIELQGASLLAAAYEQVGRQQEAEQIYLTIASRSDLDFQVRNALAAAARIRSDRGDVAGAIQLFEQAIEGLEEGSPERGLYEMRIAELRAGTNA